MYNLRRKKEQGIWFMLKEIRRPGNKGSGVQSDSTQQSLQPVERKDLRNYLFLRSNNKGKLILTMNLPHGSSGFRVIRDTGVQDCGVFLHG